MAADQPSSSTQSGVLESRMGNLSLSNNQRPVATPQSASVDLYEWDGKGNYFLSGYFFFMLTLVLRSSRS